MSSPYKKPNRKIVLVKSPISLTTGPDKLMVKSPISLTTGHEKLKMMGKSSDMMQSHHWRDGKLDIKSER